MITRSEFETARKTVQEAITRHGDLRTALLVIKNKLEVAAIQKSMKIIADYFVQTRQQMKDKQKTKGE